MDKSKFSIFEILSVMFGFMVIMGIAVLPFNSVVGFINLSITSVLAIIVFILMKSYKNYIFRTSESVSRLMDSRYKDLFDKIPFPVAVVLEDNIENIVFYNTFFKEEFELKDDCIVESLNLFLGNKSLKNILIAGNEQITYESKKFKVYAEKIDDCIVLYFMNNTAYKDLKQKYIDSRVCVGLVVFDNKEELLGNISDEQNFKVSITVENILRQWTKEIDGIFTKIVNGKYLIVFQEKYLRGFIKDKFKIVDKIHSARIDEHRYATISAGISRGCESFNQAYSDADNALNMSLGRGGDQVTLKNQNSYEFFGGTSQGFEKRSKVRTRVVARTLLEKIKSADCIFIMGHKYSDFDSVGSASALWSVCVGLKKKDAYIVINKNESMAGLAINHLEKSSLDRIFISPQEALTHVTEKSLLIIVDTHSLKFVESPDLYMCCKNNMAVIDHHRMTVDKFNNAVIFFHEPFASSTCEMVTELIQYMGDKFLKKSEAECLLAGIMLDTKNFSLKSGIRTFEAAAYLKKKGADNGEVKKMFVSSIETHKLKCRIMNSAYIVEECAVARLDELQRNARISCAQAADELLDVKNVKASFVLFRSDGKINISARSLGGINVQMIMEAMGGGGHQTMAAVQMSDMSFEEVEKKLIETIKEKISEIKNRMENE